MVAILTWISQDGKPIHFLKMPWLLFYLGKLALTTVNENPIMINCLPREYFTGELPLTFNLSH